MEKSREVDFARDAVFIEGVPAMQSHTLLLRGETLGLRGFESETVAKFQLWELILGFLQS